MRVIEVVVLGFMIDIYKILFDFMRILVNNGNLIGFFLISVIE